MGSHKFYEIRDRLDELEAEADDCARRCDELEGAASLARDEAGQEITEARDLIAAELEPVFAAIWRGDVDDARVRLRRLPAVLDGNDPILLALQRAKARPMLFAA